MPRVSFTPARIIPIAYGDVRVFGRCAAENPQTEIKAHADSMDHL